MASQSPLKQPAQQQLTYLVTGSAGYLGRHLVQGLLNLPVKRVFGICLPGDPDQLKEKRSFHSLELDILDPKLPALLEEIQPDVIIHAVGVAKNAPLKDQLTVHVEGTRHLLQSVVDAQLTSRIVLVGSSAEYGIYPKAVDESTIARPVTPYGVSKYSQTLVAQLFAQKYHLPVVIGRLFNPYGESPKHFGVASIASQIANAEAEIGQNEAFTPKIKLHKLQSFRDYIHIRDVVSGLIALSERGYPGELYNLASGNATPLRLVLEGLLNHSKLNRKQIEVQSLPQQEADFSQGIIQKIISHTGWRPQVTMEQGLREELEYWRGLSDAESEFLAAGRS